MKLRNKKTGEIIETCKIIQNAFGEIIMLTLSEDERFPYEYHSLAELNREWEDYKPAEPLIKDKDEKAREAVRAFSEVIQEKKHILVIKQCGRGMAEFSNGSSFWIRLPLSNETMNALEDRTYYTIDELCGEEEE